MSRRAYGICSHRESSWIIFMLTARLTNHNNLSSCSFDCLKFLILDFRFRVWECYVSLPVRVRSLAHVQNLPMFYNKWIDVIFKYFFCYFRSSNRRNIPNLQFEEASKTGKPSFECLHEFQREFRDVIWLKTSFLAPWIVRNWNRGFSVGWI